MQVELEHGDSRLATCSSTTIFALRMCICAQCGAAPSGVQGRRRRKVKAEAATPDDAAAAAMALEARLETAGQPATVLVEGGLAADDEGVATALVAKPVARMAKPAAKPAVRPGTKDLGPVASARVRCPSSLSVSR